MESMLTADQAISEMAMQEDRSRRFQEAITEILSLVGEDPGREGLVKTPERVEKAYRFFTSGYGKSVKEEVNGALFSVEYDEMIIVNDIDFYSLCEHHLLPFFGRCHVAYVPNGKVLGLSKIPRLVEIFSRRLQVQERLTTQIAEAIQETVNPLGTAVVMEGQHLCMMMRGVEKQNTEAVTSAMLGVFRTDSKARTEFLDLIRRGRAK
jgi:GTP cyclohydrolase I